MEAGLMCKSIWFCRQKKTRSITLSIKIKLRVSINVKINQTRSEDLKRIKNQVGKKPF